MMGMISRRRFVRISAAAAGLGLLPSGHPVRADTAPVTWRGTMLGAVATIEIHHQDRSEAERLIALACSEARRLERLFSLYLKESALVELNRTGILIGPPAEMVDLLSTSQRYSRLTGGLFDVTVQPLWDLYASHFSQDDPDPAGPVPAVIESALARIGSRRLSVERDRIVMPRGMAVTLNGIAQGYVTDKVVDLLRSQGVGHSLVDMGETRAIGSRPDGRPWEVGIADPNVAGHTETALPIVDRAVSTSGGYGFQFDATGRFNHLFDPRTGGCAGRYRSLTTVSRNATAADALSTAFSLMPAEEIRALLPHVDVERVHLIDEAGRPLDLVA
ncbi:Nitrous oxide reductase accessory protein NosX (Required for nitrous oxide reduction), ApbE-like lipoprotein [Bradyrhizobium sp. STM 3843]|uniref:FAD:protein FMN transferase n=1 Tax=Bradyrhizobium sp. STM 3843 TaxID=551947 RepID=UPI000240A513|nr:FAD:protein FMN transferase [Bradyrhizobium sp. STM 3843]CCE06057.1 Nitrous oxide reductase accessory protein NosX (Required for nitrous oxide reduction), ApbE-like lipoprotein [Bradyrhizobium sp. STM 3843]